MVIAAPETKQQRVARLTGYNNLQCPACKKEALISIAIIPRVRSPTGIGFLTKKRFV
ncbi:hypothetical protein [Breznakibacter xylanolyticus]|uniref:hypothetical protein n=1 Tax=Breznakibacter xylanolyticus TaxID=990 RepID=UPI001FE27650|nr:hypothetical protein [Breznakibacter xylanolyticus]